MGKNALDAKKYTIFRLEPETLTLVTDKKHPLYDPRVEDEPDESFIRNVACHGVIEPIIVRKNGEAIEVVAGRGRTKAALEVNRRLVAEGKPPMLVPAIVKGGSDADLFSVSISENEIRRDDNIIHKGAKARKLLNMGYGVQEIATTFGVSRQAVDKWLAANELPEPIKDAVEAGEVSATAAAQLAGLPRDEQVRRYQEAKAQGVKPTTAAMRSAAQTGTTTTKPRMKSKREIEQSISPKKKDGALEGSYQSGWNDALRWVLGLED